MEKLKKRNFIDLFNFAIVIQNGMNILGVSYQKKCNDKVI